MPNEVPTIGSQENPNSFILVNQNFNRLKYTLTIPFLLSVILIAFDFQVKTFSDSITLSDTLILLNMEGITP